MNLLLALLLTAGPNDQVVRVKNSGTLDGGNLLNVYVAGASASGLTDAQLRATAVPVSLASVPVHGVTGTFWQATQPVSGTFWQATQPVSGTFWQATQPVSGPQTDAQARATPQPVSGTALGVDLIDGGVWVKNFPVSQPVTGTFFQATQPVSGTAIGVDLIDAGVWVKNFPATQPVSGTFWQATQPVSGTVTATVASTTITGNVAVTQAASSITGSNPCTNPTATILGLSGATTGIVSVQLVAISGSLKIYVCSMNITGVSGTTPTFKLTYGTGSACATGTVGIVGPWTTAANTVYNFVGPTFAVTPAAQALCYVQTGTTPISNYNITYVQQ